MWRRWWWLWLTEDESINQFIAVLSQHWRNGMGMEWNGMKAWKQECDAEDAEDSVFGISSLVLSGSSAS